MGICVDYSLIDGKHFLFSQDDELKGLMVCHSDLRVAHEEVCYQVNALLEKNHGKKGGSGIPVSYQRLLDTANEVKKQQNSVSIRVA